MCIIHVNLTASSFNNRSIWVHCKVRVWNIRTLHAHLSESYCLQTNFLKINISGSSTMIPKKRLDQIFFERKVISLSIKLTWMLQAICMYRPYQNKFCSFSLLSLYLVCLIKHDIFGIKKEINSEVKSIGCMYTKKLLELIALTAGQLKINCLSACQNIKTLIT